MYRRSGFILKDMLIALLIVMIMFPIVVAIMDTVATFKMIDDRLIDEIAILHLQKRMIIADDINVFLKEVSFKSGDDTWIIKSDDERVYLTPGYQLFIDGAKEASFYSDGKYVYLFYIKDEREYEKIITVL